MNYPRDVNVNSPSEGKEDVCASTKTRRAGETGIYMSPMPSLLRLALLPFIAIHRVAVLLHTQHRVPNAIRSRRISVSGYFVVIKFITRVKGVPVSGVRT